MARARLSSEVEKEVRTHLGDRVYRTVIPRSVRLSEAPSHGKPIHLYAPASPGATAYRALAAEYRSRAAGRIAPCDPVPEGLALARTGGAVVHHSASESDSPVPALLLVAS